eukprot:1683462-Rhodomonas_salina.1
MVSKSLDRSCLGFTLRVVHAVDIILTYAWTQREEEKSRSEPRRVGRSWLTGHVGRSGCRGRRPRLRCHVTAFGGHVSQFRPRWSRQRSRHSGHVTLATAQWSRHRAAAGYDEISTSRTPALSLLWKQLHQIS